MRCVLQTLCALVPLLSPRHGSRRHTLGGIRVPATPTYSLLLLLLLLLVLVLLLLVVEAQGPRGAQALVRHLEVAGRAAGRAAEGGGRGGAERRGPGGPW